MSLEDRVLRLENQTREIADCILQIAKDAELLSVNIIRTLKGMQPQTTKQAAAVTEVTFTTLKFDPAKGEKLGDYEIAYQSGNITDKFTQAYNILHASNATIKDRYHGNGYQFSYWIYGEGKIYRQKLKENR
jgi:hypothetical protein